MTADRAFGLAFITLAAGIFFSMQQIDAPFAGMGDPGPKLVPYFLSVGLALFGILLVLRKRPERQMARAETTESEGEGDSQAIAPPSVPVRLGLAAGLVAYVALFERLGFTLATFAFLAFTMVLLSPRTPRGVVLAIGLAAILTLVFGGFLAGVIRVPLPGVWIP